MDCLSYLGLVYMYIKSQSINTIELNNSVRAFDNYRPVMLIGGHSQCEALIVSL